jgi:hypothetical protein
MIIAQIDSRDRYLEIVGGEFEFMKSDVALP